ncbi:hypothetical protein [Lelliottia sp. WAP21]|uniref:hypothetical protein n=1 Tax=Lelliottia sp. WAP21 TaxID=2877426 RepID=UPI001E5D7D06|nr:hypothetical protein [Lelliottia sp. WAP21]
MHHNSEPQSEDKYLSTMPANYDKPPLKTLKKRMSACVTQYAIATENTHPLQVDYQAEHEQVAYYTSNAELQTYMKVCAGENYKGNDKDKGTLSLSMQGKGS